MQEFFESGTRSGARGFSNEVKPESSPDKDLQIGNHVTLMDLRKIRPNPNQPRKFFDDVELENLAQSIASDGLIQPIVVVKTEHVDQPYLIVAGERRWRASQKAGLKEIPVIIKNIGSKDVFRLALIENIQRAELNIIEEAEAYTSLIEEYGFSQEECAKKVGKDRSTIANTLRLLALPDDVKAHLIEGTLSMGHGRALLSISDKSVLEKAKELVIHKSLNVRQTEELCKRLEGGKHLDPEVNDNSGNADLDYLAENLRHQLRTKVKFVGSGSRGKIEISYFSSSELERILELIAKA